MEIENAAAVAAIAVLQYAFVSSLIAIGSWALDRLVGHDDPADDE